MKEEFAPGNFLVGRDVVRGSAQSNIVGMYVYLDIDRERDEV
jgi:hypothetical protein